MTRRVSLCSMLLATLSLAACCPPAGRAEKGAAGPAAGVVVDAADAWEANQGDDIRIHAIVTWYDQSGAATVSAQDMVIEPRAGRIMSTGHFPQGDWTARVRLTGSARFTTSGTLCLSDEQKANMAYALRLILHRVRGPMNLLDGSERVGASEEVFTAGIRAVRVESTGRPQLATAYFFDADSSELKLVTADGAAPPEKGSVTVYRNGRLPDGTLFPVVLQVRSIGENTLVGERKILDVEFIEFEFAR